MKRLLQAIQFAEKAHRGQLRKYTGDPYIVHPLAVAQTVAEAGGDEDMVIAALLHDVVEDCGVTGEQVFKLFGPNVAVLVTALTSRKEEGNRATRKKKDRIRLANAGDRTKTIKLADLFDNMESIIEHDPKFAKVFMGELKQLLEVLKGGNSDLWEIVHDNLIGWQEDQVQEALK